MSTLRNYSLGLKFLDFARDNPEVVHPLSRENVPLADRNRSFFANVFARSLANPQGLSTSIWASELDRQQPPRSQEDIQLANNNLAGLVDQLHKDVFPEQYTLGNVTDNDSQPDRNVIDAIPQATSHTAHISRSSMKSKAQGLQASAWSHDAQPPMTPPNPLQAKIMLNPASSAFKPSPENGLVSPEAFLAFINDVHRPTKRVNSPAADISTASEESSSSWSTVSTTSINSTSVIIAAPLQDDTVVVLAVNDVARPIQAFEHLEHEDNMQHNGEDNSTPGIPDTKVISTGDTDVVVIIEDSELVLQSSTTLMLISASENTDSVMKNGGYQSLHDQHTEPTTAYILPHLRKQAALVRTRETNVEGDTPASDCMCATTTEVTDSSETADVESTNEAESAHFASPDIKTITIVESKAAEQCKTSTQEQTTLPSSADAVTASAPQLATQFSSPSTPATPSSPGLPKVKEGAGQYVPPHLRKIALHNPTCPEDGATGCAPSLVMSASRSQSSRHEQSEIALAEQPFKQETGHSSIMSELREHTIERSARIPPHLRHMQSDAQQSASSASSNVNVDDITRLPRIGHALNSLRFRPVDFVSQADKSMSGSSRYLSASKTSDKHVKPSDVHTATQQTRAATPESFRDSKQTPRAFWTGPYKPPATASPPSSHSHVVHPNMAARHAEEPATLTSLEPEAALEQAPLCGPAQPTGSNQGDWAGAPSTASVVGVEVRCPSYQNDVDKVSIHESETPGRLYRTEDPRGALGESSYALGNGADGFGPPPLDWHHDRGHYRGDVTGYIAAWRETLPDSPSPPLLQDSFEFISGDFHVNLNKLVPGPAHPQAWPDLETSENRDRQQNVTAKLAMESRMRKLARRAERDALFAAARFSPDVVKQTKHVEPDPNAPLIDIYLRPAEDKDVSGITALYNELVGMSIAVEDHCPVLDADIQALLKLTNKEKLPFMVAVHPQKRSAHDIRGSRRPKELVVGFAYVQGFSGLSGVGQGSSRYTARLHFYTAKDYTQKGIGRCLLDMILSCTATRHAAKGCCEFKNDRNDGVYDQLGGNGSRSFHQLIIERPFEQDLEDKEYLWMKQWLEDKFWFQESGRIQSVARSTQKGVTARFLDKVIFSFCASSSEEFTAAH